MTYPSAEQPDRPHTRQPAAAEPPEKAERDPAGAPNDPGTPALSEKPVLEWTTEDWARWIEEPALLSRPSEEALTDRAAEEPEPLATPPAPEAVRIEGDPTGTWSLALEDDEEDAKWWSSVAGIPDVSSDASPAPPEAAPPVFTPTPPLPPPAPPITPPPPPPAAPVITPPPPVMPPAWPLTPDPAAPPEALPPMAQPPLTESELPPSRPQPALTTPETTAPSRSPQTRRVSLEPVDDMGVRVRAAISLLGVSILVGAVAAGLITVAIFMASVVLRRALG